MKENNSNVGLVILGIAIFASTVLLVVRFNECKVGSRAAAIEKGMTPREYIDWMDTADSLR